jgi:hypothetical protein
VTRGALRRPLCCARLTLATALLLIGLPLMAQRSPEQYLQQLDLDEDGRVSVGEFQSYMSAGFDALDRNGNRVLDLDEQPSGARRRPLSRVTHLRALEAAFHRQDRNRDGYLTVRELSAPPG